MTRASILTLDPTRGGVPALARTVYRLLDLAGHQPTLVYRAQEEVPATSRLNTIKHFLTRPPVRRFSQPPYRYTAVADYPLPHRYQYHLLRLANAELRAPIAAVVSGSSHVGLPLALARRPYVLWVATVYEDELRGRAEAGDQWAAEFPNHPDWPALQGQEQLVYERASIVLGLSPHTTQRIAEQWPAVSPKLQTVFFPIDTDFFLPAHGPAQPRYLFLSARIRDPRKNVNMLLRAFAQVHQQFPDVQLVIGGDDPNPDTEALANDLGLQSVVRFVGFVPEAELVRLLQGAALYVFPSLQEGLGISVLDAMACGLPVVSTRCGGPEGLVQDGVTGLLVTNNDPDAFAQALIKLLNQPDRMQAMGQAGRQLAVHQFSREYVDAQLRTAFNTVFGNVF
jgi:glycosyltransferase involved in cell wall biosynthesis